MVEPLYDQIIERIKDAASNYHRLLLVVAPAGAGKTAALKQAHAQISAPLLNVNLEVSRRMLELTERQRALLLPKLLSEIVSSVEGEVVLLDNIEILFDVALKQDPLRLLQNLSRNKTLVVAWNGHVEGGFITYAKPEHPEYKRYPIRDFLLVGPQATE